MGADRGVAVRSRVSSTEPRPYGSGPRRDRKITLLRTARVSKRTSSEPRASGAGRQTCEPSAEAGTVRSRKVPKIRRHFSLNSPNYVHSTESWEPCGLRIVLFLEFAEADPMYFTAQSLLIILALAAL